ncbi:MAG TPA: PAS domain S-box protein [Bacteroidia bacterium]|nr:PAS domain S-box protein [Bacteroidia bacterium]
MTENSVLYKRLIEEIEDYAILLFSKKGEILSWNNGAGRMTGYVAEEVIGKKFGFFYNKQNQDVKLPEKLLKIALKNGKASYEGWFTKKNGTNFWGNNLIVTMFDENGGAAGFSCIMHDLTEKRNELQIEKALSIAKEGLMKLFNASPVGMIIADIEKGRLIEVNESFLSTFGYKREEAIGFTADELGFVSQETQQRSFGKLKEQGYLRNEKVPAITKFGKELQTIFSVELFEYEDKQCFLCIFHDISEIKDMEKRLVESENKYRKLIEEAGDVLYTSDVQGNFTYINQRVNNLIEYAADELIGKHFSVLIAPGWKEKVTEIYLNQFKNKIPETTMEFPILTKSGKEKWVEQIVIMQMKRDLIMGFQCIVHDITERKNASLLLENQKKIIEQKNRDILDSINYAKRIQDVIFPPDELIKELLPESFILFKPKDVIGGDFYWLEKFNEKTFIAAVDCTGHGVPGALLSIIGYNLLSKSINEHGNTQPNDILNELSIGINKTLHKSIDNPTLKDTMDIALCSIDKENVLEYAGAHNSLYLVRNGELTEIPADRFPVGIVLEGKFQKFKNHRLQLYRGDTIYLFSDGYADQFGGPDGKKLKYGQFRNILISIHTLPIKEQKSELNKKFEEWKFTNKDQTDDILIIGIKI